MRTLTFENYLFDGEKSQRFDDLTEEEKQDYRNKMLVLLKKYANVDTCVAESNKTRK